MNAAEVRYYSQPLAMTDLHEFGSHLSELPSDPVLLAQIVRGLLIHDTEVHVQAPDLPSSRMNDRNLMSAPRVLKRVLELDPSALSTERPPGKRMVGYCYHFALLHCALLRAKDIASRPRCGFVNYFDSGKWVDHWVTEYLDDGRWQLIDPHTGRDVVSRDEFHDGGTAWQECRSGRADPYTYGINDLWGWDELRGSLVNDLGALNKVEFGHWDWCSAVNDLPDKANPNPAFDTSLDPIAHAISGTANFAAAQEEYTSRPELHPPVVS